MKSSPSESANRDEAAKKVRRGLVRSRKSYSRRIGILFLILSGVFFSVSFVNGSFLLEVSSLTSFVLAVLLLVSSFEHRVAIVPVAAAIEGPLTEAVRRLKDEGWVGKASFSPRLGRIVMNLQRSPGRGGLIETEPIGSNLLELYETEIGDVADKGFDFAAEWLPRAIVDGFSLASSVRMEEDNGIYSTRIKKPFVRPLCVNPYFTENICSTMGCPLVNSIGEAIAKSEARQIVHENCTYDPVSQTAVALHSVRKGTSSPG